MYCFTASLASAMLALTVGAMLGQSAQAQTFKVLHTFTGPPDGGVPEGTLLLHASKLYGTTLYGGESLPNALEGNGTVFELNIGTGKEIVLHAFAGAPSDTASPVAGLIGGSAGTLYGNSRWRLQLWNCFQVGHGWHFHHDPQFLQLRRIVPSGRFALEKR
jgi:uncharacterized repeat protein (TIGR03803 family)